jgi:pyruvate carboxylase
LDAGTAFSGAVITPFYDSLLVKVSAHGLRFNEAARRMERCLQEFRVRGVKTNIPFLLNLVEHPDFLASKTTTRFLDETPALFQLPARRDRATKLLTYIAELIVNGPPGPKAKAKDPVVPTAGTTTPPPGTRDRLLELGPEKFAGWLREQKRLLVTDTTFRDAHQSLLATRMRTFDLLQVAPYYARHLSGLFSLEMWGGATFDTAMRFLKESPWDRLTQMRQRVPNVLFQMLLRAANAVGYTNYPDNVVHQFVRESGQAGIDVFRIFDSLNWLPNLQLAIDAVRQQTQGLCEAAICYTGDILNPNRTKYDLKYYVNLAKELEQRGAHILAIKDMAGLLKPHAARLLVRTLKQEVGLPIHFHTHDSAGGQMASYVLAVLEGVDVVDCASAPLSGMTSQPCLDALVEALRYTERDTELSFAALQTVAKYWEQVRKLYAAFETGQASSSGEVYLHEMPGGQYTNLQQQAVALGLEERWPEVGKIYAEVNQMFGDIVKVTPSSKVVGDMALFMLANNLTSADVLEGTRELAFPESVVEFVEGRLGQPPGGFPPKLQQRILKGRKPFTDRPGANLPPADFAALRSKLEKELHRKVNEQELSAYVLYPRVFPDFVEHQRKYSDTSVLPTSVFFHGMQPGEEASIEIEPGKVLILKFLTVGDPLEDGRRLVFFELNGQPRDVTVVDKKLVEAGGVGKGRAKADPANKLHVAAPMPGAVVSVPVAAGEDVAVGQKLVTLEAMKMETTLYAERVGRIAEVCVRPGTQVDGGDLLVRYEA